MHRLIVRRLRRDPSLVEKAKLAHARRAVQFADWPFVREWQDLLALPSEELPTARIAVHRRGTALWTRRDLVRRPWTLSACR